MKISLLLWLVVEEPIYIAFTLRWNNDIPENTKQVMKIFSRSTYPQWIRVN